MSTNDYEMAQKRIRENVSTVLDEPKDLISDLPTGVKGKILGCLSILDAARTSTLSREWRNLWCSIPKLVFDDQFFDHANIFGNESRGYEFAILINEILLLHHHSALTKFHLDEPSFFSDGKRYVDKWILFLSNNRVKELTLDNGVSPTMFSYTLPSCLYYCLELADLNLCNYTLKPPPAFFTGFPRLVSLHFKAIKFTTNSTIETVISGSKFLERLTVEDCEGVDGYFSVDAQNLKYLCVYFYRLVHLKSVPNLQEAKFMWSQLVDYRGNKVSLVDMLRALPRVEKLAIDGFLLEDVVPAGIPKVLNQQLKSIQLLYLNCTILDQGSNALFLIRCSVNLEELMISAGTWPVSSPAQDMIERMEKPDWSIGCILDQLRTVKMESLVIGWRSEIVFIAYLLGCSPNLESMHITCSSKYDMEVISRELMWFKKASQGIAISLEWPLEVELEMEGEGVRDLEE